MKEAYFTEGIQKVTKVFSFEKLVENIPFPSNSYMYIHTSLGTY